MRGAALSIVVTSSFSEGFEAEVGEVWGDLNDRAAAATAAEFSTC